MSTSGKGMDWDSFIDKHGPALLLYARQLTESEADAQEALQNAFLGCWKASRGERSKSRPPALAYVYAGVRNAARDLYRSASRRRNRERIGAEMLYEPVPAFDGERARAEAVRHALRFLPDEQRDVVIMRIWGDLSFREIAAALDIPANTAASRYRYAMDKLRGCLADETPD